MRKETMNINSDVTSFLDAQIHPFRNEIEALRNCILSANNNLTENVKWNGPNYCLDNNDCITMKIHPPKLVQLIFHRGAKVLEQPKEKLIKDDFGILLWKGKDRAIATIKNMQDFENQKANLTEIVKEWLIATK